MGSPKIVINSIWCNQKLVPLNKSEVRIGRTPDNDVVFTHQCVSRSHAIIRRENNQFVVEDLKSKHGTYINKVRVSKGMLKDQDVLHLGLVKETEMKVVLEEDTDTTPGIQWFRTTTKGDRSEFRSKDLEMLLDISRAINSTLVLQDVLNLVMDAVIQLTKAQHGFLMLFDKDGELEFKVARNMKKESINEEEFKISRSIVKKVSESGEPLISGNILQDDRFKAQQSVLELQLKTVMCVPLKIVSPEQSRVIGVIYVHNKVITPTFSTKTLDLLDYMASHAAVAIENAKLLEETRIKERMQKELEIAFEIQTSLLPQSFPDMEGIDIFAKSFPAAEVGGDFYHFIKLNDRKMGIAIGDVIGKSVPAALYMSATYSILETLLSVKKDSEPREIISSINSLLCRKTRGSNFVTFSYGIIDREEMTYTFSNAGHNYPLLLREGEIVELQCNGPALGMFDEDQFEFHTEPLKSGDYLILYTDGVIEAIDAERNMFGFERFSRTIIKQKTGSVEELGNSVLIEVQKHFRNIPQFDDMTLVCLKID